MLNVFSPTTTRKIQKLTIASPAAKRKHAKPGEAELKSAKIVKNGNIDQMLSEELKDLYKSKKHKEKMPSLIQQTFTYRRSIIENNSGGFLDLMNECKFLTDIKNVTYHLLIFFCKSR